MKMSRIACADSPSLEKAEETADIGFLSNELENVREALRKVSERVEAESKDAAQRNAIFEKIDAFIEAQKFLKESKRGRRANVRRLSTGLEISSVGQLLKQGSLKSRSDLAEKSYEERYWRLCEEQGVSRESEEVRARKSEGRRFPLVGNYAELVPVINKVRIFDDWNGADFILKYKFVNWMYATIKNLMFESPLGPIAILLLPFAFMESTNTGGILFGNYSAVTNATDIRPPWAEEVDIIARCSMVYCGLSLIIVFSVAILNTNRGMLEIIWKTTKARILIVVGATCIYSIAAVSMIPDAALTLFMVGRLITVTYICIVEADWARIRFRNNPISRRKNHNTGGKRGTFILRAFTIAMMFIAVDLFRHYLVVFMSDETALISLRVTNPFNGNEFELTNKQVADATYFTGIFFFLQQFLGTMANKYGEVNVKTKLMYN